MSVTSALFSVVNESQDNSPLRKYQRRRAETMIDAHELPVGDCVSETILRCFESAADDEELLTHLQYAAHELTKAAMSVRRHLQEASDGKEV